MYQQNQLTANQMRPECPGTDQLTLSVRPVGLGTAGEKLVLFQVFLSCLLVVISGFDGIVSHSTYRDAGPVLSGLRSSLRTEPWVQHGCHSPNTHRLNGSECLLQMEVFWPRLLEGSVTEHHGAASV